MNMVGFHIVMPKRQFLWLMRKRIKAYFNIDYCRKSSGGYVFMDFQDIYIIKLFKRSLWFTISDIDKETLDKSVERAINFVNLHFKGSTVGFTQTVGGKIPLDKFKDIEIIELFK